MLEDYVVTIRLPIDDAANPVLGAGFGLNADEASGGVWYSDGQDVWLPPAQATLFAMFRGLLRFVPSGNPDLEPPPDTPPSPPTEPPQLLPAMGDCLVLELWPQDYLRLRDLLPDDALVPKRIVFQNVDRAAAVRHAAELIERDVDQYKELLREEGEAELDPSVVVARGRDWLEREWVNGRGVGVYVDPRESAVAIGEVAAPPTTPPSGLPSYARVDHGTPAGASGFRRLTLKALDAGGQMLHPAFVFYLLTRLDADAVSRSWLDGNTFISAQLHALAELPAVRVAARLEELPEDPPDPDPPAPLPDLRLRIKHASVPVWLTALYDPFENPEQGRWRFQSALPDGEYQDTHEGPPAIEERDTPRVTPVGALTDPFFTEVRFPHWFPFYDPAVGERRRRFILGLNMETCRRKHYHDLSATDLLYDYYTAGSVDPAGRLETTYGPSTSGAARASWLSGSTSFHGSSPVSNLDLLRADLDAIRATGVAAIRVWAFEYLEGIRFGFTVPTDPATGRGSALMQAREAADAGTHPQLRSYVFPHEWQPRTLTVHGCSRDDFDNHIAMDWRGRSLFRVEAPSNPLFQELLTHAATLQAMAGARGLRVLWTLMTHMGETKPEVSGHQLIYGLQQRTQTLPRRSDPPADWATYYGDAPLSGDGRLPIEAWIYRALITDATLRQSYIDNALIPFVNHMENVASGEPLGYEVCNEIDILWNRCSHNWAMRLSGDPVEMYNVRNILDNGGALAYGGRIGGADPAFPTRWKMDTNELRTYLSDCADAIRRTIPGGRDRIIINGVLGTQDGGVLGQELALIRPTAPPDPVVQLSGSAFTKYAYPRGRGVANCWREAADDIEYGLRPIADLISETHPASGLIHDGKCVLIEAGGSGDGPADADRQRFALGQAMVLTINLGYGGIFLWNYDDPGRDPNFRPGVDASNHPITENGRIAHEPTSFVLNGDILGRHAVREIQRLSARLGRLQLPRTPWP